MSRKLFIVALVLGLITGAKALWSVAGAADQQPSANAPSPTKPLPPAQPPEPKGSRPAEKGLDMRPSAVDHPVDERITSALAQKIDLNLTGVSLKQFLDTITAQTKIEFQIDSEPKSDKPATPAAEASAVTIKVRGISVRSALRLVLKEQGLNFFVDGDTISVGAGDEPVVSRIYNVLDLIRQGPADAEQQGDPADSDYDSIIDVLTATIEPSSWSPFTAPSPDFSPFHGTLAIRQTAGNHDEIARLFAALRRTRNLKPAEMAAGRQGFQITDSDDKEVLAALDSKIDLQIAKASAEKAVEAIAARVAIPVYLDPKGALAVSGATATLNVNAHGETLKGVLDTLFADSSLTYVIQDDVLLVAPKDSVHELPVVRVYPVGDLTGGSGGDLDRDALDNEYKDLADLITGNAQPGSWSTTKGDGTSASNTDGAVACIPAGRAIVCLQTREVHEEIAHLLAGLRAAIGEQGGAAAKAVPAAQPGKPSLSMKIYKLKDDVPADDFVAVVRDLIEPQSWTGGEAYIHAVPGAIVVKQTAAIRRRVETMLIDLGAILDPSKTNSGSVTLVRRRKAT